MYVLDLTANGGDLAVTNAKVGDKLIVTAYTPAVEFAAGTPGGAEVGTTTGTNKISNIAVTELTFTALEGQVPAVDHEEDPNTATITFTWKATDEMLGYHQRRNIHRIRCINSRPNKCLWYNI
ncbi:MAG: hypothetical protein ACOX4J_08855 [Anaerovoracaceae bacterium]